MHWSKISSRHIDVFINGREYELYSLSREQEQIPIPSLSSSEPDLNWTFTDAKGHFHAATGAGSVRYPTLIVINQSKITKAFNSDNEFGFLPAPQYACSLCKEKIAPGVRHNSVIKYIEGEVHWHLTVMGDVDVDMGQAASVRATAPNFGTYFGVMYPMNKSIRATELSGWLEKAGAK